MYFFLLFFSVVCAILLCVCVVYKSIKNDLGGRVNNPINPVKWVPNSLRELLTCVSITELTFSCHFNILPMHGELRHQTRKNKHIILFTAMLITYVLSYTVSFFGYFQVGVFHKTFHSERFTFEMQFKFINLMFTFIVSSNHWSRYNKELCLWWCHLISGPGKLMCHVDPELSIVDSTMSCNN